MLQPDHESGDLVRRRLPWCYIGKRHFESALERFEHADEVEVVWRAFELDPAAPVEREGAYIDRLASKYRIPVAEAEAMVERMTRVGDDAGVDIRFDLARPGNTFDAHRLLHLGLERGVQDAVKERLLAATFTEGRPDGTGRHPGRGGGGGRASTRTRCGRC